MSQNDFNIANQGFPATRADINSALQALASNSAGTAEPSTTYAYQFWYDETNELLKMRNSDNDAWITIGTFDQVADTFTPAGVTTDKIEEGNSSVAVVDTGTGYVAITVDGVERARVDGSGNLLVGKTGLDFGATAGQEFRADGRVFIGHSGAGHFVNRIGSDGAIAEFRKDGTAVGSIGTNGGKPYFSNEGNFAIRLDNNALLPANPNGTVSDYAEDLGSSSARWSNLYLGGGVYLGGTGAANYLDDYEEGTWTPAATVGFPASFSSVTANYVKVGSIVHAVAYFTARNDGTAIQIGGLPFTPTSFYGLSVGHEAFTVRREFVSSSTSRIIATLSSTSGATFYEYYISATYHTSA